MKASESYFIEVPFLFISLQKFQNKSNPNHKSVEFCPPNPPGGKRELPVFANTAGRMMMMRGINGGGSGGSPLPTSAKRSITVIEENTSV